MAMVVRTNTMAMNANRQLSINNSNLSKSLEKLSSGYKINRAGDDAAGLAISEKMKAQIKGLDQAASNAQDGISLVQTAEGATTEIHNMLNRMVELATKSANGTIDNTTDREAIQTEVDSLNKEITRITQSTNFNGITLLDGSLGADATTNEASVAGLTVTGLGSAVKSLKMATDNATDNAANATFDAATGELTLHVNATSGKESTKANITSALQNVLGTGVAVAGTVDNTKLTAGSIELTAPSTKGSVGTQTAGFAIDITGKTGAKTLQITAATGAEKLTKGDDTSITLDDSKSYTASDINALLKEAGITNTSVEFTGSQTAANVVTGLGLSTAATVTDGTATGLTLQIGDTAKDYNKVTVSIDDLSAKGLNTDGLDVSTQAAAGNAIQTIKDAINKVSTNRANLGALQNRMEYTINNLNTTSENMSTANSRIRDTDMASEMTSYTQNNILTQAAQAMLAQANQAPQQILQLLQ